MLLPCSFSTSINRGGSGPRGPSKTTSKYPARFVTICLHTTMVAVREQKKPSRLGLVNISRHAAGTTSPWLLERNPPRRAIARASHVCRRLAVFNELAVAHPRDADPDRLQVDVLAREVM